MANLNRVLIIGTLTKDPDLRYTPKGTAIADLSLAINRVWNDDGEKKEEVTYVEVTLWSSQAENANKFLKKGKSVFIEGRLKLDTWEDKNSGQRRSKLRVVGESMQFLSPRDNGSDKPSAPASRPSPVKTGKSHEPDADDAPDDIPF